jgi:hypothetical protein
VRSGFREEQHVRPADVEAVEDRIDILVQLAQIADWAVILVVLTIGISTL